MGHWMSTRGCWSCSVLAQEDLKQAKHTCKQQLREIRDTNRPEDPSKFNSHLLCPLECQDCLDQVHGSPFSEQMVVPSTMLQSRQEWGTKKGCLFYQGSQCPSEGEEDSREEMALGWDHVPHHFLHSAGESQYPLLKRSRASVSSTGTLGPLLHPAMSQLTQPDDWREISSPGSFSKQSF